MQPLTIEEIVSKKPHLEDIFKLYGKVQEFSGLTLESVNGNGVSEGAVAYPPQLIDAVFERFSSIFGIPKENLTPLKEAMQLGQIDFTRLPLKETPAFSLPYHEDELSPLLFLLSRPFFLALGKGSRDKQQAWEKGRCPVCSAQPALSFLGWDSRRYLACSFCGTTGPAPRIGCPVCLNRDTDTLTIMTIEGDEDFRIETCSACLSYSKTARAGVLEAIPPDYADLMSLPLDIIAQGRGYRRNAPNPLGMIRIA